MAREVVVTLRLDNQQEVRQLGQWKADLIGVRESVKLLTSIIKENGSATASQARQLGELTSKAQFLSGNIRELGNKLSGATDAGLRFRDKMAEAFSGGLEDRIGEFGTLIAGAFTAHKLIEFLGELRSIGLEIEQTNTKAKVLFGDGFAKLEDGAKAAGEQVGVSKDKFIQLASTAQDVFTNLGLSKEKVADLSTELATAAGRIGEFSIGGKDAAGGMEILKNAVLGSTRGLKELNIPVKGADAEIKRLSETLQVNEGLTKQQADAQARLQFALEKLNPKIAEYVANEGDAAKASKAANAQIGNLKEELAERLEPAFIAVTQAGIGFLQMLHDVGDAKGLRGTLSGRVQDVKGDVDALLEILNKGRAGEDRFIATEQDSKFLENVQAQLRIALETRAKTLVGAIQVEQLFAERVKNSTAGSIEQAAALFQLGEIQKRITELRAADTAKAEPQAKATGTVDEKIKELTLSLGDLKTARLELQATDTTGIAANDRQQAAIQRQIDALTTSAKAEVKIENEKAKQIAAIEEKLAKIKADFAAQLPSTTKKDEQEIQAIRDKFAAIEFSARGNATELKRIDDERTAEINTTLNIQASRRIQAEEELNVKISELQLKSKDATIKAEEDKWNRRIEVAKTKAGILIGAGGDPNIVNANVAVDVAKIEADRDAALFQARNDRIAQQAEIEKAAAIKKFEDDSAIRDQAGLSSIAFQTDLQDQLHQIDIDAANKSAALNESIVADEQRTQAAIIAAKQARRDADFNIASGILGIATTLSKSLSTDAKTAFEIQKALALAQIVIDEAKAISSLIAASAANPLNAVTFGTAGTAQFAEGAIQIAAGVAQAIALLNQSAPGFERGGYTPSGHKSEVAGVAHKGEWYAPKSMVEDKRYAPMIAFLEDERLRGGHGRADLPFTSGGFATSTTTFVPTPTVQQLINVEQLAEQRVQEFHPVVSVVEINKVQGLVKVAENLSTA